MDPDSLAGIAAATRHARACGVQPRHKVLRKGKRVRRRSPSIDPKVAESLAIQALTFLVEEPERMARFLALTGIDPGQIRQLAQEPGFLAAVLRHLREDEGLLRAFADREGLDPATVGKAAAVLAGPDWERDSA
ncbi:MAG: DUF3572 domain-containing protein [Variibacter sp.]|nr:DUF3572 domain-containing protein [Variibacter sp.]